MESSGGPTPPRDHDSAPQQVQVQQPYITIQVGEREFKAAATTLTDGSTYFASMLSGKWSETTTNSTSFVDGDPELFTHILSFLRRGIYPLLWSKEKGFDFVKYAALLAEARYFGISRLEKWIEEKHYLMAVTVNHIVREMEQGLWSDTIPANVERIHHPSWGTKKVYRCPRKIPIYDDNPDGCGRACDNARVEGVSDYVDVPVMRVAICESTYDVKYSMCMQES